MLVALSSACTETPPTRIDGRSVEGFARTTAAAREDLLISDRLTFDGAIASVAARRYANHDPAATARAAFDGMTAADVVQSERERMSRRVK